jgi:hypothetical protein
MNNELINDNDNNDNGGKEEASLDQDPISNQEIVDIGFDELEYDLPDTDIVDHDAVEVEIVGNEVGRPSKLTTTTLENLVKGLKLGLSNNKAATFAGISSTTFYRWQQDAQKIDEACSGNPDNIKNADDLELWEFWESIKKAKVDGEISHLAVITDAAANGIWQASAWFLERSNPKDWSKREHQEKDDDDKPIVFQIKYSS